MTAKLEGLRISIRAMNSFLLLFYIKLMPGTTESVIVTSTIAQPQLLSGQEIGFTCGSDYCDRKGFVFCVAPPLVKDLSDAYCLSCNLKKNTCGTPDEIVGCNLYCEELLLNQSATKCEETIKDLRKCNTELSTNQMNQNATEYEETIKKLRKDLENMTTRKDDLKNVGIGVIVMLSVIVAVLVYTILRKPATKRTTTSDCSSMSKKGQTDKENSDGLQQSLHCSKESGIEEDVHLLITYEATKNESTKKEHVHPRKTGTLCYGEDKLKNVQPVDNEFVKLAVGNAKEHTIVPMKSGEAKVM